MKIADYVNVTKNSANNQISFTLKARQLKKSGITPQTLLNINFLKPKNLNIIKKEVKKNKWKK